MNFDAFALLVCLSTCLLGTVLADIVTLEDASCPELNKSLFQKP